MELINDYDIRCTQSTGTYLTESSMTELTKLELLYNNKILSYPTNPHASRVYHVRYNSQEIKWAYPASVPRHNNIRTYFQWLLRYQDNNKFLILRNFSDRKLNFLISELTRLVLMEKLQLKYDQLFQYLKTAKLISQDINFAIHDFNIKFTEESEIAILRQTNEGIKYIIIGEKTDEVSFVFITKVPGKYSTLHIDHNKGITLNQIVETFLS